MPEERTQTRFGMETTSTAQAEPAAPSIPASVPPAAAPAAQPPAAIPAFDAINAALANPAMLEDPKVEASLFTAHPEAQRAQVDTLFKPPTQPPVAEPAPAPAAEVVAPVAETPPAEAPAAPEGEDAPVIDQVTNQPIKILPNRIRTAQFSDMDQRAIALQSELKSQGIEVNIGEAFQRVQQSLAPLEAEPEPTEEPSAAAPVASPSTQALEAEVANLRAQQKELAKDSSLYTPEIEDLNARFATASAELAAAKVAERTQSVAQQVIEGNKAKEAGNSNFAATLKVYPEADNLQHPLGAYVATKTREIKADPDHPQRALISGPDAVSKIVSQSVAELTATMRKSGLDDAVIAKIIGKASAAPPAPTVVPPVGQVARSVPRTAAVTASGNAAPAAPAPAATPEQALFNALSNPSILVSPEMEAALYGSGNQSLRFG